MHMRHLHLFSMRSNLSTLGAGHDIPKPGRIRERFACIEMHERRWQYIYSCLDAAEVSRDK